MSQYSLGTISVTNGSPIVAGVGTKWSTALTAGQYFAVKGEFVWYVIASVNSDSQITLTTNYVGVNAATVNYIVQRDFTPVNNYPLPSYGDQGSASLIAKTLLDIDASLAALSTATQALQGNITVDGTLTISGSSLGYSAVAITASHVDSTPIGATTPSTGAFTLLNANELQYVFNGYAIWNGYANAGVWKYAATGTAFMWQQSGSNLILWDAPSGTTGGTITWTKGFQINADTNLVTCPGGLSLGAPLPVASGGTGVAAFRTAVADAFYNAIATDRAIAFTSLSVARNVNLPAANTFPAGVALRVFDESGQCNGTNVVFVQTATVGDTLNGVYPGPRTICTPYGFMELISDGVSKWTIIGWDITSQFMNLATTLPSNAKTVWNDGGTMVLS